MTLRAFLDEVASERKTIVVYVSDDAPEVTTQFESRNVTVERESLPPGGPGDFVVIRDDDGFVSAFGLDELETLLSPPTVRPWNLDDDGPRPWRSLYQVFDDTFCTSLDRRQLLAAAREIENRAWRIGIGTLRVGFQRTEAYNAQRDVYRRLACETDLSIHVYVDASWNVPEICTVTYHQSSADEIEAYWFLVFDAAGDPLNRCALLAEERTSGTYAGFWTYDGDRVDAMATYLAETYE